MEAVFEGRRRLLPRPADLSFFNWVTQSSAANHTPTFQARSLRFGILDACSPTFFPPHCSWWQGPFMFMLHAHVFVASSPLPLVARALDACCERRALGAPQRCLRCLHARCSSQCGTRGPAGDHGRGLRPPVQEQARPQGARPQRGHVTVY